MPRVFGLAAALSQAAACGGVGTSQTIPLAPLQFSAEDYVDDYRLLTPGDVLLVEYPYRPDFSREVTVRTDGKVSLPFVGTLEAAGRMPEELEASVREAYEAIVYSPAALDPDRKYLINVGDELEVRFRSADALNATVRVRPDGRISLDRVKSIMAEGKSPEELEAELIDRYSAYLTESDLVVIVSQYTSERVYVDGRLTRPGAEDLDSPVISVQSSVPRQVYVGGEVRVPGLLSYQPPISALQAILASGGVPRSGELDQVVVLRRFSADSSAAIRLNLGADVKGEGTNDILLRPFDIVIVPKTGIARLNDFFDQYLYQLVPLARNVNFSFFYDLRNSGVRIP